MTRNWWHANSTANDSRERRYARLWQEGRCREDLQSGETDIKSTPFALANKYDISERAAKRLIQEAISVSGRG